MTMPNDPRDPVSDPNLTYPTANDIVGTDRVTSTRQSSSTRSSKAKAAALLAGATALAGKLRQEAPKKVHDLQEKRAAGRCVILTEVGGRSAAVGPYPTAEAARQALGQQSMTGQVVDLLSPAAYSSAAGATSTATTASTTAGMR
jgi:hypothetical protein